MTISARLSLLDLATVGRDQSIAEAMHESVVLAQTAERLGRFERIWFAEHHNMPSIASSATAVLIGHVAAQTSTIRLGSGGVMLPNHSPLVIAEQFGTLATLYPGRIDLGLGRAPGTDQRTLRALRRSPEAAENFPDDVVELQGYLSDASLVAGINAYPGRGTKVPLYILGSSLFGAQLAAHLGLPYAFASHFAPDALHQAVRVYRERFQPSQQASKPYLIVAANAIVAEDASEAQAQRDQVFRERVRGLAARQRPVTDDELPMLLDSPLAAQVQHMMRYTASGTRAEVHDQLSAIAIETGADELMLTNQAIGLPERVRTLELLATV